MSSGGSAQRKPKRVVKQKQSYQTKKERAVIRARAKLQDVDGDECASFDDVVASWASLATGKNHQKDQDTGNGIILTLLNVGLSQIEIYTMLKCGAGRVMNIYTRNKEGAYGKGS
jgi:hypothetical protein